MENNKIHVACTLGQILAYDRILGRLVNTPFSPKVAYSILLMIRAIKPLTEDAATSQKMIIDKFQGTILVNGDISVPNENVEGFTAEMNELLALPCERMMIKFNQSHLENFTPTPSELSLLCELGVLDETLLEP